MSIIHCPLSIIHCPLFIHFLSPFSTAPCLQMECCEHPTVIVDPCAWFHWPMHIEPLTHAHGSSFSPICLTLWIWPDGVRWWYAQGMTSRRERMYFLMKSGGDTEVACDVIRHSLFAIPYSPFLIRHSLFVICHSSFVTCHSSFVTCHSSFVIVPHSSFFFTLLRLLK